MREFILVLCLVGTFVVIETAMVRSARKTRVLADPAMQSLVGIAAQRSMTVRIIVGTIGAIVASFVLGTLLAMGICAALGLPL